MGVGRNPQFWSSNGAQPEIRQENRNHAHDFKFPENLKIRMIPRSRAKAGFLENLLNIPSV